MKEVDWSGSVDVAVAVADEVAKGRRVGEVARVLRRVRDLRDLRARLDAIDWRLCGDWGFVLFFCRLGFWAM